jgi:hypothetical protein
MRRYTTEEKNFIRNNIIGRSHADMTKLFNEHFDLEDERKVSLKQMTNFLKNNRIRNGLDSRFRSGPDHICYSKKGRKGYNLSGNTLFKKGPENPKYVPMGSERNVENGYIKVKIGDPKIWQYKHIVIWEEAHGKVPKDHFVLFADRDRSNFSLDNLILVSRRELGIMNLYQLISTDKELTMIGKSIADIKIAIADLKIKRDRSKRGKR